MMMRRIVGLLILLSVQRMSIAGKLTALDVQQQLGKTTIFCTLTDRTVHHLFTLNKPNRVVLDLDETTTKMTLRSLKLGQGLVTQVRSGHPKDKTLRLVFEVKQAVVMHATPLHDTHHPFGLRIDLDTSMHRKNLPVQEASLPVTSHHPEMVKHSPSRSLRDVLIVLDPGHGGKDPGALGARRNAEKNVVLAIAVKLKQMIDRQPGMRAVLTRNGDYYVGLRERLNIARKYNADVFIAIHADAFVNQHSHGASVFALSQRGATSEAARWLAEKENYSELGGVNLSGLDDDSGLIRTVLIDLSQTATIGAGLQIGTNILQHLANITALHNTKVEQARFVVLKSPDIPSVLVETGFISNPNEERNLTSQPYQTRLSQAIFAGIKQYFWDHPIQGTRLEAMLGHNEQLLRAESHHGWFPLLKRREA